MDVLDQTDPFLDDGGNVSPRFREAHADEAQRANADLLPKHFCLSRFVALVANEKSHAALESSDDC